MSDFTYNAPDDARFFQLLVRYLELNGKADLTRLLRRGRSELVVSSSYSRNRWNAYWTTLRLTVPIENIAGLTDAKQKEILEAAGRVMPAEVGFDLMEIEVSPAFDESELVLVEEPRLPAVTIDWTGVSEDAFERLIFDLVNTSRGYRNATWLTHTNAPDDGRDLAVERVHEDSLAGTLVSRVIIACRHWLSKSTGPRDLAVLREQMALWSPPRVDVLVVATSGRFTTPAVRLIDLQNQSDSALRIEPWPSSKLEALLASRPDLVTAHRLVQVPVLPRAPVRPSPARDEDEDIPF